VEDVVLSPTGTTLRLVRRPCAAIAGGGKKTVECRSK
jgi:hypothetical protein